MGIEIFFSYAHKDEALRDKLAQHLRILEHQKIIDTWYDRDIDAGQEWMPEIEQRLNSADIILLLISADFLSSDYCYDVELKQAMKRHEQGSAKVIPIILRPVAWDMAPFRNLQALPQDSKPVTSWSDQDAAFVNIVEGLQKSIAARNIAHKQKHNKIYSALLRLGYRQQARLFRSAIDVESVAAFLIHGLPQRGQRWLLNRLAVRHLPEHLNSKIVKVHLGRLSMKTSIDALWRDLGCRVQRGGQNLSPLDIAEGVYQWWLTQDVIFVLHDVQLLQEDDLNKLIDDFWLPLTEKVQEAVFEDESSKLLLFLVDYVGKSESWNSPSLEKTVEKLDANWNPGKPIKPPIISEFTEIELIDWLDDQDSDLPQELTTGIDQKVEEILQDTEDGVPELVLREICERCGLDWYEGLEKWIRL
ncbi:MAG: TIR domain-containing protein [Cyanobacteria bacterium P01_F01_bin.53]